MRCTWDDLGGLENEEGNHCSYIEHANGVVEQFWCTKEEVDAWNNLSIEEVQAMCVDDGPYFEEQNEGEWDVDDNIFDHLPLDIKDTLLSTIKEYNIRVTYSLIESLFTSNEFVQMMEQRKEENARKLIKKEKETENKVEGRHKQENSVESRKEDIMSQAHHPLEETLPFPIHATHTVSIKEEEREKEDIHIVLTRPKEDGMNHDKEDPNTFEIEPFPSPLRNPRIEFIWISTRPLHEGFFKLSKYTSEGECDEFDMNEVNEEVDKMIRRCGGLPLAVRILGGLLSTKRTASEWKMVHDNIGSQIIREISPDQNVNQAFQVLSLSYEDLPFRLKHCFLYLAHFPEDYEINTEKSVREMAEIYLEELVKRNLVLVSHIDDVSSRIVKISVHDVMRDVCLLIAKEENFLEVISARTLFSSVNSSTSVPRFKSRRLVVHFGSVDALNFGKLRLRVLDLYRVYFPGGKFPKSIGKLVHLRYLRIEGMSLSKVPSFLGNLTLLVFLDLGIYGPKVHIPNVLKRMKDLRYLVLPYRLSKETKLELGSLVKLETLENFSTKHCRAEDLLSMKNLRQLRINVYGTSDEEALLLSLNNKLKLEEFVLCHHQTEGHVKFDIGGLVSGFPRLHQLRLEGVKMERLPDKLQSAPCLTTIWLKGCRIEEDPMPILEKMPNLKEVCLQMHSFVERKMACSRDGFPQLRSLHLYSLQNLEEWAVEEGSTMPRFRRIWIQCCPELEKLPDGLRNISTLKELDIVLMKREFMDRLVEGGEHHYKVQHIPCVTFDLWDAE
ncbi:PREDICTED: probable disease resistance RPP8-like protein 2 [Tarenaya hassleriana]|uniref:probable disease resistance RPP8-like protein 2 n=1 Tax=Tarenaya hassleriana TaxID=28532 RepID=UPI00053C269D|nr:PREDICTED: probable disease resistance RPP8-like protein 2 [Tarenaya hassleriana]